MNRVFNKINNNISKKRRKYSKELLKTSKYFEKGERKCRNNREKHIMLCRDISTINSNELNTRQKEMKVRPVIFIGFYIMLFGYLLNILIKY